MSLGGLGWTTMPALVGPMPCRLTSLWSIGGHQSGQVDTEQIFPDGVLLLPPVQKSNSRGFMAYMDQRKGAPPSEGNKLWKYL